MICVPEILCKSFICGLCMLLYSQKNSDMLNKNTLGVKKCEAKKKQHCKWVATYATKSFDINQGQEIMYQNPLAA